VPNASSACCLASGSQPGEQFVFVDECSSNIGLTPLYAHAPKGQRAHASVLRHRGQITTLIASLSPLGMGAALPGASAHRSLVS